MAHRFLAVLAIAAAVTPALAATADPLQSAACQAARDELEQAVNDAPSKARSARIAAARTQAATACLGRADGRGVRSGAPDPARAVAPPVISAPAAAPTLPPAALPVPPLAIPRPIVITTCDPAGCWDSEGRRLNSMGPLLMGPRGPCTLQGGVANCP